MHQERTVSVVGSRFHPGAGRALGKLRKGMPVSLVREAENKHDSNAVACYDGEQHLGYIPSTLNGSIAGALDAGLTVKAVIDTEAATHGDSVGRPARLLVTWED